MIAWQFEQRNVFKLVMTKLESKNEAKKNVIEKACVKNYIYTAHLP